MKKFKILEHPAELRLRIFGKTIEELFVNGVEAMSQVLASKTPKPGTKTKKTKIKIISLDLNTLLVDFLNEILGLSQINKKIYLVSKIKIKKLKNQTQLEGELSPFPIKRFKEDIKAVTYYQVNIKKNPKGIWQTDLVFDI
jgi:SHS2 domain-containing protein